MFNQHIFSFLIFVLAVQKNCLPASLPYPIQDTDHEQCFPPLPNYKFSSSPLAVFKALNEDGKGRSSLNPLLIWFASSDNDRIVVEEIKRNQPTLEIKYIPSYEEAVKFLSQNTREIQRREKAIVICRGNYPKDRKRFTDFVRVITNQIRKELAIAVFTSNKTVLLERVPNPPENVEIFDTLNDLLYFINKNIK